MDNDKFNNFIYRWLKCQNIWVGLYTNLNQLETWLDQADKMVLDIGKEGLPLKDMKQKQKDLEKQVFLSSTYVVKWCQLN